MAVTPEELYKGKRIAILGYGVEGQATYKYLVRHGFVPTILEENEACALPDGVEAIVGAEARAHLDNFDLVFRAPSALPNTLETSAQVTTYANEFLQLCPAMTIGVTGTKGKGTVASLVYEILKAAGKTVWLGGNVGVRNQYPPLSFLDDVAPDDIVVLELSDLVLWDIQHNPHIAVLLAITPEHLDWHPSFEQYIESKSMITQFQSAEDTLVYYLGNEHSNDIGESSPAKHIGYPNAAIAHVRGDEVWYGEQRLIAADDVVLVGHHNLENICAAVTACWPLVQDKQAIIKALKGFKVLEHRLEYVRSVRGVDYYNDSIGTNQETAIAALRSFAKPKVIMLGGSDKGLAFDALAKEMTAQNVRATILIGQTAPVIRAELEKAGFDMSKVQEGASTLRDMSAIVNAAAGLAEAGDVVLLSPACASFGMFKDYKERGQLFKQAVKAL